MRGEAGRLEGLSCLLGVEMSQPSLRRQTKLQVNKEKGKTQEADITTKKSCRLFLSSVRDCNLISQTVKVHTCEITVNILYCFIG